MASPQAGMAALTGTLAGTQQGMITFTQQNEQEADRIGIQVLQRSGLIRRQCRLSGKIA
jgi:predicted Zn-dependent protease